ncbi:MAG: terminase small subunit [Candidatus Levybacteria bacterium]|nr:terminase small subunit [Candidatus Levybacteria bacterium]
MNLTLKQRNWLKLYLETGNATEAAVQSYDCKDRESAAQVGYENLRKLDYRDFLEEAGITDELLLRKIAEGLDANRTVSAVNTSKNSTASSTDFIEVADYAVRLRYLEIAFKLKQRLIERKDITTDDRPLPVPIYGGLSVESTMPSELREKYRAISNKKH